MHYSLSHRDDSQYWKDIKQRHFSNQLLDRIPTSKIGYWQLAQRKMFNYPIEAGAGETYIAVGMNNLFKDLVDEGYNTFGFSTDKRDHINNLKKIYNAKKARWLTAAENSPTLYEYLKKYIFNTN